MGAFLFRVKRVCSLSSQVPKGLVQVAEGLFDWSVVFESACGRLDRFWYQGSGADFSQAAAELEIFKLGLVRESAEYFEFLAAHKDGLVAQQPAESAASPVGQSAGQF